MANLFEKLLGGLGIAAFTNTVAPVNQASYTSVAVPHLQTQAPVMPGALASLYNSQGSAAQLPQGYESAMNERMKQFEQSQALALAKARQRQMDQMASMGIARSTDAATGLGEIEAAGLMQKAQFEGGLQQSMMDLINNQQNQQNQLLANLYGSQANYQLGVNQQLASLYGYQTQAASSQYSAAVQQQQAQQQRQSGIAGFLSNLFFPAKKLLG